MKIVSWNVYCDNGNTRAINELVKDEDPDILCLQEISESLKEHMGSLREIYPHSTFAIDHYSDGFMGLFRREPFYLFILSKIPFEGNVLKYKHSRSKVRTSLARVRGWHECIEHHGVNILAYGVMWRILNIHIGCADTQKNKRAQFERVVQHFNPAGVTIVCGDFNTINTPELPHLPRYIYRKIVKTHSINDLLVGEVQVKFARRFEELGMQDIFKDRVTHPDTGTSLDKILVPKMLSGSYKHNISSKIYDSDHLPLIINFDSPNSI